LGAYPERLADGPQGPAGFLSETLGVSKLLGPRKQLRGVGTIHVENVLGVPPGGLDDLRHW
jgi:hypothetical protein